MEPDEQPFDAETLASDLELLCGRIIERAFDKPDLRIQKLYRLAETTLRTEWQENPIATLEAMLRTAILQLDGPFGVITEQEAALRMFNLNGGADFPDVTKRTVKELERLRKPGTKLYDFIYEEIVGNAKLSKSGDSTIGKMFTALRREIAANLIDLYDPNATAQDAPREPPLGSDDRNQSATQTLASFDPFELGVHRPIVVDSSDAEPALPPYAERLHDRQLRELLTDVTQSLMVVLTGGSSTGKTRTAWEAVTTCLSDWQFYAPRNPEDFGRLVEQRTEQSRIVVWLDEAQEFLQADPTQMPGTLQALLTGPGLVVVLATMWTDPYWQRFTTEPTRGEPDTWRQLRALLLDSRRVIRIRVPGSFADEPAALETLRGLAQTDKRLAEAVSTASDGEIIQTLSGGTLLVARYLDAVEGDRHAWAVITAAIDACRLGHERRLPVGVLKDGALGYLTEDADRVGDEDWFAAALRYATHEVRGVAILRPARTTAGIGSADSYVLDDYVLQHGQHARKHLPAPADLWDALADHVNDRLSSEKLAKAAETRYMYRVAIALVGWLAERGSPRYVHKLVQLAERFGSIGEVNDELIKAKRALGIYEGPEALRERAITLHDSGSDEEAHIWWVRAAVAGDTAAMAVLAKQEEARGKIDSAVDYLEWYVRCLPVYEHFVNTKGKTRRQSPYWGIVTLLCRAGRIAEAEHFWRIAINHNFELSDFIEILGLDGENKVDDEVPDERRWLLRAMTEEIDFSDFVMQLDDVRAEEILRYIATCDAPLSPYAMEKLSYLLDRTGQASAAAEWLRKAAEAGNAIAMCRQAERFEADGQEAEAQDWWWRAARAGDAEAIWYLIQHYEESGSRQEVDELWNMVMDGGDGSAWYADWVNGFAKRLIGVKRADEAEALLRRVASTSNTQAMAHLATFLIDHGSPNEAEKLLRRAILLDGNGSAHFGLCDLLEKKDLNELDRLLRFGLEPNGETAEPWE